MMRVLFICLGNICRSPTAEAVARGKGISCDSAGTAGWHVGKPPYGPMQEAASARSIDMAGLRARQLEPADFDRFDLLIVMDEDNRRDAEALRPAGNATQLALLTAYGPADQQGSPVPDPYFTRDFDGALDLIEECVDGLAEAL
ncbi:MAG: low molecular weight protein-tyrosine-phosphatase [Pseudomonadota bacterium]